MQIVETAQRINNSELPIHLLQLKYLAVFIGLEY
jgi:hypothetical protein